MEDLKKFLKEQETKKSNYEKYNSLSEGSYFIINKYEMFTDYEMILSKSIKKLDYGYEDLDPNILIFVKIDNDTCVEFTTGITFARTEYNDFYNEATGLYFNFEKNFYPVYYVQNIIFTQSDMDKYEKMTDNFFNEYIKLMNEDNNKRAKLQLLLLNQKKI